MSVSQLGYLQIGTPSLDPWRELATGVIGAEVCPGESSDVLRLRFDEHHHRITLRAAETDSILAVGWETRSPEDLEAVRGKVMEHGLDVTEGTREERDDRRVEALFRFKDLDGVPLEIYYGPQMDDVPFHPSRPMSGFNCGPLGLGHVVLVSKDTAEASRFYQEALGFSITDYIGWDELDATFLRCNPRHHSLALTNECYGMKSGKLNHFMLETRSLDDVGRAYDFARGRELALALALGQHSNDLMTSFYVRTPSGFSMEYGWGGLLIDEARWSVKRHTTTKLWGHEPAGA